MNPITAVLYVISIASGVYLIVTNVHPAVFSLGVALVAVNLVLMTAAAVRR